MIIIQEKWTHRVMCALGMILAVFVLANSGAAQEVAVIKVQYRRAAELVPVVQSLLSTEGSVTVSQRVNSLVIIDIPEAIQRVHAYLDEFDRPVEQVRIRIRFHTSGAGDQDAIAARGRYSNDDFSVATGGRKKDGATILFEDHGRQRISHTEAFVVAMSGSPAFIRTGKEIPYKRSSPFFKRHVPGDEAIAWRAVESGFEVTPTIIGDNVVLRIVPRIAYDDREDAVIRFFGAQTELTAPIGQWVEIGGTADQQNEIINEILSQLTSRGQATTSMSLMVQRP